MHRLKLNSVLALEEVENSEKLFIKIRTELDLVAAGLEQNSIRIEAIIDLHKLAICISFQ